MPIAQAETLVALLAARSMRCATAESCTGGSVGAAITAVSGASRVYSGGVVSYANEAKRDILGVDAGVLERYGAVSAETAEAMAEGARRLFKSDLAVSVTGIAGPDGGSAEKPVGLVWFGLATPHRTRSEKAIVRGDREGIRREATIHALGMLQMAV